MKYGELTQAQKDDLIMGRNMIKATREVLIHLEIGIAAAGGGEVELWGAWRLLNLLATTPEMKELLEAARCSLELAPDLGADWEADFRAEEV